MNLTECEIHNQDYLLQDYPYNLGAEILGENVRSLYWPGLIGALKTLAPREEELLKMRYVAKMTYREMGQFQGLSAQRIRQIVVKALRKLRHPSRSRRMLGISLLEHRQILEDQRKKIEEANRPQEPSSGATLDPQQEESPIYPFDLPDLSIRSFNALRRSGIDTVRELVSRTPRELSTIRGLGYKSFREIVDKLAEHELKLAGS